jgi:hypothetical protein
VFTEKLVVPVLTIVKVFVEVTPAKLTPVGPIGPGLPCKPV